MLGTAANLVVPFAFRSDQMHSQKLIQIINMITLASAKGIYNSVLSHMIVKDLMHPLVYTRKFQLEIRKRRK